MLNMNILRVVRHTAIITAIITAILGLLLVIGSAPSDVPLGLRSILVGLYT